MGLAGRIEELKTLEHHASLGTFQIVVVLTHRSRQVVGQRPAAHEQMDIDVIMIDSINHKVLLGKCRWHANTSTKRNPSTRTTSGGYHRPLEIVVHPIFSEGDRKT